MTFDGVTRTWIEQLAYKYGVQLVEEFTKELDEGLINTYKVKGVCKCEVTAEEARQICGNTN